LQGGQRAAVAVKNPACAQANGQVKLFAGLGLVVGPAHFQELYGRSRRSLPYLLRHVADAVGREVYRYGRNPIPFNQPHQKLPLTGCQFQYMGARRQLQQPDSSHLSYPGLSGLQSR
jgi:hypothetical protein